MNIPQKYLPVLDWCRRYFHFLFTRNLPARVRLNFPTRFKATRIVLSVYKSAYGANACLPLPRVTCTVVPNYQY